MSVRFSDGRIELAGECPLEDAEPLLGLLIEHPGAPIDLSHCAGAHTAVVQLILAAGAEIVGESADPFLQSRVLPGLRRAAN